MCGWTVTLDATGRCPLGHRVFPPLVAGTPAPPPELPAAWLAPVDTPVTDDSPASAPLDDLLDDEPSLPASDGVTAGVKAAWEESLLSALDELEAQVSALHEAAAGPERESESPERTSPETESPAGESPAGESGESEWEEPGGEESPPGDEPATVPGRRSRSLPWGAVATLGGTLFCLLGAVLASLSLLQG
jgi:hypothetical protein